MVTLLGTPEDQQQSVIGLFQTENDIPYLFTHCTLDSTNIPACEQSHEVCLVSILAGSLQHGSPGPMPGPGSLMGTDFMLCPSAILLTITCAPHQAPFSAFPSLL